MQKRVKTICLLALTILMILIFPSCAGRPGADGNFLHDGNYQTEVALSGGTGKVTLESPAQVTVKNNEIFVTLVWSSKSYDYMIVDGVKYLNENEGGRSTFTIPVRSLDEHVTVIADTTAMSRPHEIEYVISFGSGGDPEDGDSSAPNGGGGPIGNGQNGTGQSVNTETHAQNLTEIDPNAPSYDTLKETGEIGMRYAEKLSVKKLGDYRLVTIAGKDRYLIVPEGGMMPRDIPYDITVLCRPFDRTYLVSSPAMDLIVRVGALGDIRLSGNDKNGWYVKEAQEAMERGDLLYAGKYSAPDYELLLSSGCNLAIENTMLLHDPGVKEKLNELGIPVLMEYSSYENHPFGRLEWIKLYGTLFDREEEAEHYYEEELARMKTYLAPETGGGDRPSAAFFYISSGRTVNIRKPGDYISRMIDLAGGRYLPEQWKVEEDNALATVSIQLEEFFAAAKNADILIYNGTIVEEEITVASLLDKSPLFADFKAVKENRVYRIGPEFYQRITEMGDFMEDLSRVFAGEEEGFHYLEKVQ